MFRKVSIYRVSTTMIVRCERVILIPLDLQLLPHARPVGTVQSILIEPFDVETEAAERQKDHIKFAHQFLFGWRVVAWVPL